MNARPERIAQLCCGSLLLLATIALIRSAWVCDDAYITFRSIDNFIEGYGLRWNVDERVQSFTHPLWALLLSALYAINGEIYFTSIMVSMMCSLGVFVAIWASNQDRIWSAVMGLALLLSSKAFIDYSTSGLENPLSHLLLALFYLHYFRSDDDTRGLRYSALFAAFLVLNRMDLLLMVAPPLMLRARRVGWKSAIPGLLLGFVPLISWLLFSLIYYGFPFPNTAYAKLSTGISRFALIDQGLAYFVAFLRMDWLGLPIILASVGCALIARDHRLRAAGIALLLYLLYLLSIGGDFMNGRFFAAPLLVGVLLVVQRFAELRPQVAVGVAVGALALALINPYSSLRSGADYGSDWAAHPEKYRDALTHIADERGFYYPTAGLLLAGSERYWPSHQYVKEALEIRWQDRRQLVIWDSTGYRGYFAGPQVFILDRLALTDPLLSKLPAYIQKDFYIGHFARLIPPGYVESLTQKQNRIEDEGLAKFYDDIRLITRGPLFASGRWAAIWRTNLGLNRKWYAAYARSAQLGEES